MATKVRKVCVSFPAETLAQLDWLREHVLLAPDSVTFSGLIQAVIGLAYFKYQSDKQV